MLNSSEIANKTFNKTFGMGYRVDDVDQYLQHLSYGVGELLEVNSELEKKLEVLADKLNEYREDEESLRSAVLGAQKLGDSIIRESKTKAEIVMRDATIKAEAMLNNAQRQIDREKTTLENMKREVAAFKNRLIALYKQHIELLTSLPGEIETKNDAPAAKAPAQAENQTPDEACSPSDDEETGETAQGAAFFDESFSDEMDASFDGGDPADTQRFGELQFGEAFELKRDNKLK